MITSTNLRLSLLEETWLDPEHFEKARELSKLVTGEVTQWQTYLNILALLGFEQWLSERIPQESIDVETIINESSCSIDCCDFKVCVIATEQVLDEVVNVPQKIIEQPQLATHFYVVVEVLEEEAKVIIRGILRYDQLRDYITEVNLQPQQEECNEYYRLPLSLFDAEPNHLLFYCRFLTPNSIPLPIVSGDPSSVVLFASMEKTRTKLSQWLENIFEEGWHVIDTLINPIPNLAWHTRNVQEAVERAKLIDLGMSLSDQTVALLVNITERTEDKLGVLIQLHPTGEERYLPQNFKLTLLSKTGKTLQEVISRSHDNYIQLRPFKGEPGKCFCIKVSYGDASIQEDFEL
ncbi:DUF1822 family protein [Aetokthonos hydrillicola Thurmond2011]|jgi:hypothetical protein|uniref:DUF1822 family protein n=1 Tax=Aetokthonos hydrillicola Thurmond2011 TaxID=2712845 RepID=A0AAP5I518_9CYAN|nr:DUF1822 family protein [Aetokthonos hydrillicola]MBO3463508.1 DUF1822 family protein [Aetokthonos hydrillicola CCALA 1050]MBW4590061.1 DUF1822 family protein [Aetokthonos hydrillicola CCALA 1050]MDR9894886.1 DUF1822 family protein [Aetokthonos hydrillicola Thurmond2011]